LVASCRPRTDLTESNGAIPLSRKAGPKWAQERVNDKDQVQFGAIKGSLLIGMFGETGVRILAKKAFS